MVLPKKYCKLIVSSLLLIFSVLFSLSVSALNTKIVGGVAAADNAYPFMVALEYQSNSVQFCGGSLITKTKVLTAAHCITNGAGKIIKEKIQIKAGTNNLTDETGTVVKIKSITRHASYNKTTFDYDVAILTLAQAVTLSDKINLINLPQACTSLDCITGVAFPGTSVRATGWGYTVSGGETTETLNQVDMSIISNGECEEYGYDLTNRMICADGMNNDPAADTCQGDSGGPLFAYIESARAAVQAGIVSYGDDCAVYPGVYTRISDPSIRAFILKNAGI